MKKMFLLLLCCPVVLVAQSGITISDYSVTPGAPATVSFTVSWNKDKIDSAWVFVDYNDSGTMTRLPLSGVTASAGSRAYMVDGNDRGAWVVAGASGAFSATVQLVATCKDARPCVPTGACVYAIDYPPVGKYTAYNEFQFRGTPPFYIWFAEGGSDTHTLSNTAYSLPENLSIGTFTDASGATGIMDCGSTFTAGIGQCSTVCRVEYAMDYNSCRIPLDTPLATIANEHCTDACVVYTYTAWSSCGTESAPPCPPNSWVVSTQSSHCKCLEWSEYYCKKELMTLRHRCITYL
ncbi:MAG: hypothetical protein LBT49_04770 [Prevotellaceae bacterium]|jgi:hypothetical protein|nr:hypothetical protein [Prevotellaceae bacterium]